MVIYNQFKISLRKHHFQIIGNLLFYSFISCYPYEKEQDLYSGTYELKTEALDATWRQIHGYFRGEEKLPIIGDFNNDCSNKLVINEFMARNETTSADQDGEYDPWIELYNNGPKEIPLNGKSDTTITTTDTTITTTELWGYFLSDNDSIWAFPDDAKIPGNDFLVVWADKETDQKGLHTNFELSALGGTLFLLYLVTTHTTITTTDTTITTTDTTTTIVNQINYFEQVPDLSLGRYPNGVGLFYTMFPTDTSVNKLSFSGVEFFTNLNKTVYRTVSDTGYIDWSTKENCSNPEQECYYKKEYYWDKGQKEGEFLIDAKSKHLLPSSLDRLKIELSFPVLGMNYNNKDIYSNDLIMTYNFNEVIGTYFNKISDEVIEYEECFSFE